MRNTFINLNGDYGDNMYMYSCLVLVYTKNTFEERDHSALYKLHQPSLVAQYIQVNREIFGFMVLQDLRLKKFVIEIKKFHNKYKQEKKHQRFRYYIESYG